MIFQIKSQFLTKVLLLILSTVANCQTTTTPKINPTLPNTTPYKPFEQSTLYKFSSDHRQIFIPNSHRPGNPELKFSITNSTITKVYNWGDVKWGWVLSNHFISMIEIRQIAGHNITKYEYEIPGTSSLRELCFDYAHHNALWYSTYQNSTPSWPMDNKDFLGLSEFNSIRHLAHDTIPKDYYRILEHLFINTDGFAVVMDEYQPLFYRRHSVDGLCFFSNNSLPYPLYRINPRYKDLSLTIFAGKDMRSVLDYVVHYSGLLPKPKGELPELAKFAYPSWSDYKKDSGKNVTENDIVNLANDVAKYNFSTSSEILIDDHLQAMDGNLELSPVNFPNGKKVIADLQKRGFRIGLGVSPRISKHADNSTDSYFVRGPLGEITNLVDFSTDEVSTWYEFLLEKIKYNYGVDSFVLNTVDADWGMKPASEEMEQYPAQMTKRYIEAASKLGGKVLADVAYKTQHLPNFVRLTYKYQSSSSGNYENLLSALIPNMLAISIAGYPFVAPYPINAMDGTGKLLASPELYIRYVQAVTFMPMISFEHPPWVFGNASVIKLTKTFVDLHQTHSQTFVALAKERLATGAPVIRPLWYEEPENKATYKIADQFMVGQDILVAPVLKAGQRERSVYLLAGTWVDQHGASYIGPATINVKAPLEELPYFKRKRT